MFRRGEAIPAWFDWQISLLRDCYIDSNVNENSEKYHSWAYDMGQMYDKKFVTYHYDYFSNEFTKDEWQEMLDLIRQKKVIIFSCDVEGWSITYNEHLQKLHYALQRYDQNFPSRMKRLKDKIFFISGNLVDNESYKKWCKSIDSEEYVNIIELMSWDHMVTGIQNDENDDYTDIERFINKRKEILSGHVTNFFINLSRRTRIPRTYLSYKFHQLPEHWRLISHDSITRGQIDGNYENGLRDTGCPNYEQVFSYMKQHTPFIADTTDFNTNYANTLNYNLHLQSYFNVVSETFQQNWNNTSMFFSEKTFKPMIFGMPFLIYGQQGCNQYLKKLGYNLYEDLFDYSFDSISDDYERADALHDEVVRVCKMLDGMEVNERLDWVFKCEHTMYHNIKNMLRPKNLGQITNHPYFDKVYEKHNIEKSA